MLTSHSSVIFGNHHPELESRMTDKRRIATRCIHEIAALNREEEAGRTRGRGTEWYAVSLYPAQALLRNMIRSVSASERFQKNHSLVMMADLVFSEELSKEDHARQDGAKIGHRIAADWQSNLTLSSHQTIMSMASAQIGRRGT